MTTGIIPLGDFEREVAKSFGKEAANSLFGFLKAIINPPSEELGELLRDGVRYYRFKNQVKVLLKAQEFLKQLGKPPQPIQTKVLAKILEHSCFEEDERLQERWASLLHEAASGSSIDFTLAFADILGQLTSTEVAILDKVYRDKPLKHAYAMLAYGTFEEFRISETHRKLVIDNFQRLNLIAGHEFARHLSWLGLHFVHACTPPALKVDISDAVIDPPFNR